MLSRIEVTGSTSATHSYAAIPLLDDRLVTEQSQLVVTVDGTPFTYVASGPASGEYTLNKTTRVLTLGDALTAPEVLRIVRVTENAQMLVVFANLADLSAENLNLALKQLLFLNQERVDDIAEL